MTDISTFKRNASAMRDGEWISPGPEYGEFQLKARALGYEYLDRVAAARKLEARKYGGDEERIPSERRAQINTDLMIELGLIDVKGLTDNGKPITFDQFKDMVRDPAYGELTSVCFTCCNMVGRAQGIDLENAAGNSDKPSATT